MADTKIVCMIPARLGSQRLKHKNLLNINGESILRIAVKKALSSECFDDVYVNTESQLLWDEVSDLGVKWYKRSPELADNVSTSEDFVFDFLAKVSCDYVVQLHSIAPLLKLRTIKSFVDFLKTKRVGSLFSVDDIVLETVYRQSPVNFSWSEKSNSQDLHSLKRINWALTGWNRAEFLGRKSMALSATYLEPREFYSIESWEALMIKTEEDFNICRAVLNYVD